MFHRSDIDDRGLEEHHAFPAHNMNRCSENHKLPTHNPETPISTASVSLLKLPTEIQLQIVEELTPLAKAALKFSCTYFNTLIIPHRISLLKDKNNPYRDMNVTEVETWPIFSSRGLYGCSCCGGLRPPDDFDDDQLALTAAELECRMCFRCRVRNCNYWPGQRFTVASELHVLCIRCCNDVWGKGIGANDVCVRCEEDLCSRRAHTFRI